MLILYQTKNKKAPLKSFDFRGLWSEMGDSNSRHLAPKLLNKNFSTFSGAL